MTKQYKTITQDISEAIAKLRKELPDAMAGFSTLSLAATKNGILDKKTKELIALALSVALRSDDCIGFHSQILVKLGASREELLETLAMAIYMGGGPSLTYAANVLSAFEEFSE